MRKFIIPAQIKVNTNTSPSEHFSVIEPVLTTIGRGEINSSTVEVDSDSVVELLLEDGTIWIGPALELPLAFKEDPDLRISRRNMSGEGGDDFRVPLYFEGISEKRGVIEKLKVKVLSFFRKKGTKALSGAIVRVAAQKWDDFQQPQEGLFSIHKNWTKHRVNGSFRAESNKPYLLLIHGTASSFDGSFGKLDEEANQKESNELFPAIIKEYDDRILAFEHHTLTKTPIQNALDLVRQLPDEIELHLISHSRGGMIGELLCLFDPGNEVRGFSEAQLRMLAKQPALQSGLNELIELLSSKQIRIGKFIRVACPARGTHLCSDRLDLFFNVLLSGIKYFAPAAGPAVDVIKEIILSILACKEDADILPGIEVMSPDSNFVKALNQNERVVSAPLIVIQGHSTVRLALESIVTLITKLIYYSPNDWIVNTDSMTGGLNRKFDIATYYFADSEVNHFRYFGLSQSRAAMLKALYAAPGVIPAGFTSFDTIEDRKRGWITGSFKMQNVGGKKPVVIILPGILGSNLSVVKDQEEEEIYLTLLKMATGGMKRLAIDSNENIKATSVVGMAYKDLAEFLSSSHDVYVHPFDWRKSIESEAVILSSVIESIQEKVKDKPIRIIAHSMGGVLARHVMIQNRNKIWEQISRRQGFRLLLLGCPLGGSYLIPEVLVGVGKRIKQLSTIDFTSDSAELLSYFARYDGLLNLLPLDEKPHNFGELSTWNELKKNWNKVDWTIPDVAAFNAFRRQVISMDQSLYDSTGIIYIAGKSDETIDSYYFNQELREGRRLEFTSTPEGDGSVTWKSGIPSKLHGTDRLYYVNTGHGDLADDKDLFSGILDLLHTGTTLAFSREPVKERPGLISRLFRSGSPVARSTEALTMQLLEMGMHDERQQKERTKLRVKVKCGDIGYHSYPVIIGHFESDGLWGGEAAMNRHLDGMLQNRVDLGIYPGATGTMRVFEYRNEPKAIIVGIGDPGKVTARVLEDCIMRSVISYAIGLAERGLPYGSGRMKGLSFLMMGSNYIGLSVRQSLEIIISAVNKANQALRLNNKRNMNFTHLEFIEIYEDKACLAFNELSQMQQSGHAGFVIDKQDFSVTAGLRKRLARGQKKEWWVQLTVTQDDHLSSESFPTLLPLQYSLSENLARVIREKHLISLDNIADFLNLMSVNHQWSRELALALYTALIPDFFREALHEQQNIKLVLDEKSAEFPWELIQNVFREENPLATRCGLIRQLSTGQYRARSLYPSNNKVLVIGDPFLEGWTKFSQLPGAKAEAFNVESIFKDNNFEVDSFISKTASENYLGFKREKYRMIHLSGHGEFDVQDAACRGFVIGKNRYLRTIEFRNLLYVPEFVFVNACYLGQMNAQAEKVAQNRHKLAANIGKELIQLGVKAVVVSGWAVDDHAALSFAKKFYHAMLQGETFADALLSARRSCFEEFPDSNTWGAYQAYGDPMYRFHVAGDAEEVIENNILLEPEFLIELQNILQLVDMSGAQNTIREKMKSIEMVLNGKPAANARAHELMGKIYSRLGDIDSALNHYHQMRQFDAADYSVSALENECLLKCKKWSSVQPDSDARRSLLEIEKEVESLLHLAKTRERYALLGEVCKSIWLCLKRLNASEKTRMEYLEKAKTAFQDSVRFSDPGKLNILYPLINKLTLEFGILHIENQGRVNFRVAQHLLQSLDAALSTLGDQLQEPKEYREKMYKCNIQLFRMMVKPRAYPIEPLLSLIKELWKTEGGPDAKSNELQKVEFLLLLFGQNDTVRTGLLEQYKTEIGMLM